MHEEDKLQFPWGDVAYIAAWVICILGILGKVSLWFLSLG